MWQRSHAYCKRFDYIVGRVQTLIDYLPRTLQKGIFWLLIISRMFATNQPTNISAHSERLRSLSRVMMLLEPEKKNLPA